MPTQAYIRESGRQDTERFLGCPWPWKVVLGGALIYIGALALLIQGLSQLVPKYDNLVPAAVYDYRLVTPTEAMRLVNDEGWRVSERIRMTDQAVYLYRARHAP